MPSTAGASSRWEIGVHLLPTFASYQEEVVALDLDVGNPSYYSFLGVIHICQQSCVSAAQNDVESKIRRPSLVSVGLLGVENLVCFEGPYGCLTVGEGGGKGP